jgi:hypothetical protein
MRWHAAWWLMVGAVGTVGVLVLLRLMASGGTEDRKREGEANLGSGLFLAASILGLAGAEDPPTSGAGFFATLFTVTGGFAALIGAAVTVFAAVNDPDTRAYRLIDEPERRKLTPERRRLVLRGLVAVVAGCSAFVFGVLIR